MIFIKIKVFAILKDILGQDEFFFQIARRMSCQDVFTLLKNEYGSELSILEGCAVAINGHYAHRDSRIAAGDELAILPPVSGG
ncbi:MAG: MoaD/ThiS family protein [Candidatus Omnitrophica bacterium]|nr:MoaD/ThiS family protein [Candidatus Omnitrophota bacterium]